MGFKTAVNKIKRTLLCCRPEKKKPLLKIGPTTDVRRMDITEGMPDLTEADAKLIQEKATHDAYRLLSLQSHPPTQPSTPTTTDPFASSSALAATPTPTGTDPFADATPSAAASTTHLPSPSSATSRSRLTPGSNPPSIPQPPGTEGKTEGAEGSPSVTQKIWDRTRRLSGLSISRRASTYSASRRVPSNPPESSGVHIELSPSPSRLQYSIHEKGEKDTKSGASVIVRERGFEVQDTVGGSSPQRTPGKEPGRGKVVSSPLIERAGNAGALDLEGESSEEEVERRPLVRV